MLDIELMINTRIIMCLKRFLVNKVLKSRSITSCFVVILNTAVCRIK